MKILIVSDNHGRTGNFKKVIEKVAPIDMMIHCGDAGGSGDVLMQMANCPLEIVSGNSDDFSTCNNMTVQAEREFTIGRHKIWLVHGHRYSLAIGNGELRDAGIERGVDIVMYGHTHRPLIDIKPDITMINPGSLEYPRQQDFRPSFIIMDLDREGEAHFTVGYL
jgi:putative phosphoesterase